MKEQILFNPDNSGNDIFRTIKTTYHKISTANLIRGGAYGASGVLEIETIQELINADSNGNARAIRACYGQCRFDSVFRRSGQGITGVMEETEPKIVGYTRDSKGKVVKRSLRDTSNTVTTFTGSGCTTDMYASEPKINIVGQYDSRQNSRQNSRIIDTDGISYCMANGHKDGISNTLSTITKDNMLAVPELRMEDGCMVDKEGRRYRIRKLTPTECFRLMDVYDSDIEKMKQAGIAKTNLYKLAGNSIVVSCMYHLFRKLFIEKENESQTLL